MPTEAHARTHIDALLEQAGWGVCDLVHANLGVALGVAIREFPLKPGHGVADYLLYVKGKACGVIEAKRPGATLKVDPYRQPIKGDLLCTLVGSYGIPVRVKTTERLCVQRYMAILRPHSESPMVFFTIELARDNVLTQAKQFSTGNALMTVPLSGLRSIAFGLGSTSPALQFTHTKCCGAH